MFFEDDSETLSVSDDRAYEKFKKKLTIPVRESKPVELFTDLELMAAANRDTFIFDTECYRNYWLIAFKSEQSGKVVYLEKTPVGDINYRKLEWILWNFRIVGFNSLRYDMPMIALALKGCSTWELKQASDAIIQGYKRVSDVLEEHNAAVPPVNHIDVFDVAPLPEISLKTYSGRLHAERMQDLPYDPDEDLDQPKADYIREYCINDLDNTSLVFRNLKAQIELREAMGREYDQDLRSKSDAQIAEAVLVNEIARIVGRYPRKPKIEEGTKFRYQVPDYIQFKTPMLAALVEALRVQDFELNKAGYLLMPVAIGPFPVVDKKGKQLKEPGVGNIKLDLWGKYYSFGMGGLHSNESGIAHISDENATCIDDDAESFYPRIIINQKLFPKHLGPVFLEVYETIVNRRIAAKKSGDKVTADSLKITINGSFGKLGSKYSALYSPDLLLQVTITGQLSLLMLIEMMELNGIPVISANTDGVVKKCPNHLYATHEAILREWERITNFKTEQTQYKAVYSRDVNAYIAIKKHYDKDRKAWVDEFPEGTKLDKKAKGKGAFGNPWLGGDSVEQMKKNPEFSICVEAVTKYLADRTPLEQTIRESQDIKKFVGVRNMRGGAEKDGLYLGKVVRWYYAAGERGDIRSVLYGGKLPKSDGAKPCMDLPATFPTDIDYDRYIGEAADMLYDLGYAKRPGSQIAFF